MEMCLWAPLGDSLDVQSTKGNSASWAVSALLLIQSALRVRTVGFCMSSWVGELPSAVRVGKACKLFRVCVHACPVDPALCTTTKRRREFLVRTKPMFLSCFQGHFFLQVSFTLPSTTLLVVLYIVKLKPWKTWPTALKWWSLKNCILGKDFCSLTKFCPLMDKCYSLKALYIWKSRSL